MVSPSPMAHPTPGLCGTDLPVRPAAPPWGHLVPASLGSPGGRLHGRRGPVSRLGLMCHKKLLMALGFRLVRSTGGPDWGEQSTRGERGPAWAWPKPPQSRPLCGLLPSSCSAMWKPGCGGGPGPAPFPPPCPASHRRGSEGAYPRGRHAGGRGKF